jgi:hypothetical protein
VHRLYVEAQFDETVMIRLEAAQLVRGLAATPRN